jgi:hypothetical protein
MIISFDKDKYLVLFWIKICFNLLYSAFRFLKKGKLLTFFVWFHHVPDHMFFYFYLLLNMLFSSVLPFAQLVVNRIAELKSVVIHCKLHFQSQLAEQAWMWSPRVRATGALHMWFLWSHYLHAWVFITYRFAILMVTLSAFLCTHYLLAWALINVADPDDFLPDLDPDPTFENVPIRFRIRILYKFSDKLLHNFFWPKYALKSIFMNQKVKQQVILKYLWLLYTPKKLILSWSFINARIRIRIRSQTSGSGSDQKGPDPTRSGSATLVLITYVILMDTLSACVSIE